MAVSITPRDLIDPLDTDWAEQARENDRRGNQNEANLKTAVDAAADAAAAAVQRVKVGSTTYTPLAGTVELPAGVVAPATTFAQRDAITSPTIGALVLNTEVNRLQPFGTSGWQENSGFGDGSDGDVVITGIVTLARDMQYRTLQVPSGATLITNGWTIRAARSITVASGGTVHDDGGNGANATTSGGKGGNASRVGGNGGPGGSANGNYAGGGGGAGGGAVVFLTPSLVNNGTIRARGGNGGNGGTQASSSGSTDGQGTGGIDYLVSAAKVDYYGGGFTVGGSFTLINGVNTYTPTPTSLTTGPPSSLLFVGGRSGNGGGSGSPSGVAGSGGSGGLILTFTRSRTGTGTYAATGGTGGTNGFGGGVGSTGTVGTITHVTTT